jgi:hypothetical protein
MASNSSADASGGRAWRLCYWIAVASVFTWAAWQRFALPLDPIADPDTWGYLSPALRKLTGAEFGHMHGRNFIYPGLLFLLLRGFGDFRAITVAQHLLGLVAGGVLLITWRRARVFLPNPRIGEAAYDVMGLTAAAIFLFAGDPIHFEMQIRPEGVCAFLISINLWLVLQFIACLFIENRQSAATACGIVLVFNSILLASVKPSFVLVAVMAVGVVAIFFFRRDGFWQKMALGGGAVVSALLLLLPEHSLSRKDEKSRTFLPTTLFVIHANLIRDQMADDLQHSAKIPYPREWLERVYSALNAEIAKSATAGPRYYATAGLSPDYLMYNPTSIAVQLRAEFGGDVTRLCAFYRFYYWRIWSQRPLLVLQKIARQMSIFYSLTCPAYNRRKSVTLADEYERGIKSLETPFCRKTWTAWPAAVDFMSRTATLARSAPVIQQGAYIREPLRLLAATYLPLLFIAGGLSAFVLLRETHRRRFGWLAVLVVVLFTYNLASCLEVAVVHLLEYSRYLTVQMYFTLLAQFFALWFVLELALEMRDRARGSLPRKG